MNTDGAGLPRGDGLPRLDDVGIPGRGQGDGHGKDRPEAVDDVEPDECWNAQAVAVDDQTL